MKSIWAIAAKTLVALVALATAQDKSRDEVKSFYELKTNYLDGKPADLGAFKGKVVLVVNVTSRGRFTPQYEGLEKLQRDMADKPFSVLGFPSNDFGGEEPGSSEEITTFCKRTYDVTFRCLPKW